MKCRICGNDRGLRRHVAKEMMFGLREKFPYLLCPACGCLQIEAIPADMGKYYPEGYYSYQDEDSFPAIAKYLIFKRDRYAFSGKGLVGKILNSLVENAALGSMARLGLTPQARILDVGCGSGALLKTLRRLGFEHLTGIDPYNKEDLGDGQRLEIRKADLGSVDGEWDVIMLHHVFEHLEDQPETLREIHRRLSAQGTCIIRIPLVSSWVWEHYGVNWVQLDAPRHFFMHSVEGMRRLALAGGFRVTEVVFDSNSFQIWGSELYDRDIALQDARNVRYFFKLFPLKTLLAYARRAKQLNAQGLGDQAAFYLQKAT